MTFLTIQSWLQQTLPSKVPFFKFRNQHFANIMSLWPPFVGAGIKVNEISDDWKSIDVELKLRWYNTNYVGSHFGGSLFSMTDPFFMLMLINVLGTEYHVWDQTGQIKFLRPGRSHVTARFRLDDDIVESILERAAKGNKVYQGFTVDVLDDSGRVVAKVDKTIYIRRKQAVIELSRETKGSGAEGEPKDIES